MAKKRKLTSIAAHARHLKPASPSFSSAHSTHNKAKSKQLNLSAYHPDLDPTHLTDPSYLSLLPHSLVHPSQIPAPLLKYWRHRFDLFSLYSSGCLLDEQSWYSITPESVAFRIAKRCATDHIIIDLFAGAGGNAIQLAMTCGKVIAVEIDEVKLRLARWNARVYGVEERIWFVRGDSMELLDRLEEWRSGKGKGKGKEGEVWNGLTAEDLEAVEAVFLSPPWGGVNYASAAAVPTSTADSPAFAAATEGNEYSLSAIKPIHGRELFRRVSSAFRISNIAYYLPRNTSLVQLSELASLLPASDASERDEKVKVEYQYVNKGTKLSSLTAYYGALATEWDEEIDDWKSSPPAVSLDWSSSP
ncbi:hypothetical protein NDA18_000967 [Ustilago nuda]|nr:hypothetical protein NDA18_000967 [Ustilago nuda]